MFDYDVVIIGGGPAGLTAGLYLSRAKRRTLLLEKESFGGPLINMERIENYPGFADGVPGAQLATEMVTQATSYGLELKQAEVVGIALFSNYRWVNCADGAGYTTSIVIIAGGAHHKKLGVPGEEESQGKGIFSCAFCDGGQFEGLVVAVCGGGDSGVSEALYMTKLASKVIIVEALPTLTASAILQERALASPKLEIRTGVEVKSIVGENQVEAIELVNSKGGKETLKVNGVLVQVGLEPNSDYLKDVVPLDSQGGIIVNDRMQTEIPCILAAGDIRSDSSKQIICAAADGATAAITAERFLQELT